MKVNDLIQNSMMPQINSGNRASQSKENTVNFADTIKNFIQAVNADKIEAGKKVEDVASGKSENLAEAMVSVEEAKLSFDLMLEVRNKLMESFQELNRMTI